MKLRERFVVLGVFIFFLPNAINAQCDNETSIVTYDSIFSGTGNGFYEFSFPKFDASLGTLTAVEFQTVVSVKYGFTLENRDFSNTTYRVRVSRYDEFSHPVFLSNPLIVESNITYGPYTLGPNDGIRGEGDDFMEAGPVYPWKNDTIVSQAFNTADFMGLGPVTMEYWTGTYSATMGGVNNIKTESADDTMHVTIRYIYCANSALPAGIKSFTVKKQAENVMIQWRNENELKGRTYTVEKSSDGKNFSAIATLNSTPDKNNLSNYLATYTPALGESGRLIFRIKQTDANGTVSYSALRVIELEDKETLSLSLFPNPAGKQISVIFNNKSRNNWSLEIFSAHGKLVERRNTGITMRETIYFDNRYANGMYVLKAVNKTSGEVITKRFIISGM